MSPSLPRDESAEPKRLGNREAREGCDRCPCGSKYWEADRCIDCGTTIASLLGDPQWLAENREPERTAPSPVDEIIALLADLRAERELSAETYKRLTGGLRELDAARAELDRVQSEVAELLIDRDGYRSSSKRHAQRVAELESDADHLAAELAEARRERDEARAYLARTARMLGMVGTDPELVVTRAAIAAEAAAQAAGWAEED